MLKEMGVPDHLTYKEIIKVKKVIQVGHNLIGSVFCFVLEKEIWIQINTERKPEDYKENRHFQAKEQPEEEMILDDILILDFQPPEMREN